MENNTTHLDKTNYNDVFLRQAIVALLGYLRNRFAWTNISKEHGEYLVQIPIHYSMTGKSRFILDSFYDDIPNTRVNMNTDQIPRGVLELKSWAINPDEFTNPNVWFNVNQEIDDELVSVAMQTKAVPMKLTFSLSTIVDNEIDVFKCWQTYMNIMWIYKYFTFEYNRVPINAVFQFVGDTDNNVARDYAFDKAELLKTEYIFEVHTYFPIFDYNNKIESNDFVYFNFNIDSITQNNNNI
jgi:hypothetical protein